MSIRIRMMIRLVPSIAPLLDVFDMTVAALAIRVPRSGAGESRRKRTVWSGGIHVMNTD
uniref:hypothetical protein n=1 Tax=Burkholderia anthina TaxID=179879 RepID=UPI0015897D99|nr:hypothetical protein [Burkholderia anthina]